MANIRCKFRCTSNKTATLSTDEGEKPARLITLTAVSADCKFPSGFTPIGEPLPPIGEPLPPVAPVPENAIFGKYTPYGNLEMTVLSPNADHLVVGKDYYLTISPA